MRQGQMQQFREITRSNEETARGYLEACGGRVDLALELFLQGGPESAAAALAPVAPPRGGVSGGAGAAALAPEGEEQAPPAAADGAPPSCRAVLCVGGSPDMHARLQAAFRACAQPGDTEIQVHAVMVQDALRFGREGLVDALLKKGDPVVAVVPLSDCAVPLCDQLSAALGIAGNDPASSDVRRDKLLMQTACRYKRLRWARSEMLPPALPAAVADAVRRCGGFPVVLKPSRSAGTDSVALCHSLDAVERAAVGCLGRRSYEGVVNDILVLQEYLQGQEYVVNTVSCEGRHWVTDIWRSNKHRGFCYDYQSLVTDCGGDEVRTVVEYTLAALDAVQFRIGAAHTEVIATRSGACLVEINARAQGDIPRATNVVGYDQFAVLARALSHPESLDCIPTTYVSDGEGPAAVRAVFLTSPAKGFLVTAQLERIRALPTFKRMCRTHWDEASARSSSLIPVLETVDLNTCPGAVLLEGGAQAVALDARYIRNEIEPCLFKPGTAKADPTDATLEDPTTPPLGPAVSHAPADQLPPQLGSSALSPRLRAAVEAAAEAEDV